MGFDFALEIDGYFNYILLLKRPLRRLTKSAAAVDSILTGKNELYSFSGSGFGNKTKRSI